MNVTDELKKLADGSYRDFHLRLIPGVDEDRVLGVRVPAVRALAKRMSDEEKRDFLHSLPHRFYDEDMLHSVILSGVRDFDAAAARVKEFLPFVDNWAVCDALAPKAFGRAGESDRVRGFAYECMDSPHLYTARFERVAKVSGGYYLDMAAAWFFCDALIKRWDETLPYFERGALAREVHVKAVRKAAESFRVPEERKRLLRALTCPPVFNPERV